MKRLIIPFLLLLNIQSVLGQCPVDPSLDTLSNNLVFSFPFDGDLINEVPNSEYEIETNNKVVFADIPCGKAAKFNGIDAYLKVNKIPDLTGNFTFSFKTTIFSIKDQFVFFAVRDQCPNTARGYCLAELTKGDLWEGLNYLVSFTTSCDNNYGGDIYNNQIENLPVNKEFQFTVVVKNNSSENRAVSIYKDCQPIILEQVLDLETSSIFSKNLDFIFTIGAKSIFPAQNRGLDGLIRDFKFFSDAKKPDEICNLNANCVVPQIEFEIVEDCSNSLLNLHINDPESGVEYWIANAADTTQKFLPISVNDKEVIFPEISVNDTTNFVIIARNRATGCTIIFKENYLVPFNNQPKFIYEKLNLCVGDSAYFNGDWISKNSIVDSIVSTNDCDLIFRREFEFDQPLIINIGNDSTLCLGENLVINAPSNITSPIWSDNSVSQTLSITENGSYFLEANDVCNSKSNSINVNFEECPCNYFFPNSFTPNGDGINDVFFPRGECKVGEFTWFVYNRWGKVVAGPLNGNEEFNGFVNNQKIPSGLYLWISNTEIPNSNLATKIKSGTISVIY